MQRALPYLIALVLGGALLIAGLWRWCGGALAPPPVETAASPPPFHPFQVSGAPGEQAQGSAAPSPPGAAPAPEQPDAAAFPSLPVRHDALQREVFSMPRQEELGDVLEAALLIAGRHAESCLRRGRWSLARMVEEDYMVLVMLDRADDGTRLALRYVESPFANPPVVVAGCLREALDGLVLPWDADPAEVGRYMQVVGHALAGYPD